MPTLRFKYIFFEKNYASLCKNLYIIALFLQGSEKKNFFNAMRNELNSQQQKKQRIYNFMFIFSFVFIQ